MTFVYRFEELMARLLLKPRRRPGRVDEGLPEVTDPYRALYPPQPESDRRVRELRCLEERR